MKNWRHGKLRSFLSITQLFGSCCGANRGRTCFTVVTQRQFSTGINNLNVYLVNVHKYLVSLTNITWPLTLFHSRRGLPQRAVSGPLRLCGYSLNQVHWVKRGSSDRGSSGCCHFCVVVLYLYTISLMLYKCMTDQPKQTSKHLL